MINITIIGSRPNNLKCKEYEHNSEYNNTLKESIKDELFYIANGKGIRGICGLGLGYEQLFFEALLEYSKENNCGVFLESAIPYREQSLKWNEEDRERYDKMLSISDNVIYVDELNDSRYNKIKEDSDRRNYERKKGELVPKKIRGTTGKYNPIKIRLKNRYAIDRSQAVIILLEGKANKELDYCVSYALENRKTVYYIDLREGIK